MSEDSIFILNDEHYFLRYIQKYSRKHVHIVYIFRVCKLWRDKKVENASNAALQSYALNFADLSSF